MPLDPTGEPTCMTASTRKVTGARTTSTVLPVTRRTCHLYPHTTCRALQILSRWWTSLHTKTSAKHAIAHTCVHAYARNEAPDMSTCHTSPDCSNIHHNLDPPGPALQPLRPACGLALAQRLTRTPPLCPHNPRNRPPSLPQTAAATSHQSLNRRLMVSEIIMLGPGRPTRPCAP